MNDEYVIRVQFKSRADTYPDYIVAEKFLTPRRNTVGIPEPSEAAKKQGFEKVDYIEINVYRKVE